MLAPSGSDLTYTKNRRAGAATVSPDCPSSLWPYTFQAAPPPAARRASVSNVPRNREVGFSGSDGSIGAGPAPDDVNEVGATNGDRTEALPVVRCPCSVVCGA